jgi:hypothetical protein
LKTFAEGVERESTWRSVAESPFYRRQTRRVKANPRDWLDASLLAHTTSMRPNVEEVIDADPAADLAAEEENKLINEVHIDHPQRDLATC